MVHTSWVEQAQDVQAVYWLLGPKPIWLINACFVLVAFGQVSLNLLIGTFLFSKGVRKRSATSINLLLVTVLTTIPSGLLCVPLDIAYRP